MRIMSHDKVRARTHARDERIRASVSMWLKLSQYANLRKRVCRETNVSRYARSFWGRSWKPRAEELFTAPSWGIKEPMEVEMGATLYRTHRSRAERRGEAGQPRPRAPAQPPAPRGGEHPHPPRGVGAGTDGPREGPGQLARTSGPVNPIADPGQKGSKDTAPKIRN